jgi:hypothetical protein
MSFEGTLLNVVMPGLVPGIHVLRSRIGKDVDGRDEPGHDEYRESNYRGARFARIRCNVRRCMLSRRAVSETLRLHIS